MPPRRTPSTDVPTHFFVKELGGEPAPEAGLMGQLCQLSMQLFDLAPWNDLDEGDLFLVPLPDGRVVVCSILGRTGDSPSLNVYMGMRSYLRIQQAAEMAEAGELDQGEFFGRQHMLRIVQAAPGEMEAPDRALLRGLGLPATGKKRYVQFRSFRPRYLPWYVNAEEAATLRLCAAAAIVVVNVVRQRRDLDLWQFEGHLPILAPRADGPFDCKPFPIPLPEGEEESAPVLGAGQIDVERARLMPQKKEDWAIDQFYLPVLIGSKTQRPYPTRMTIVANTRSGLLYGSDLHEPAVSIGQGLWNELLKCIARIGHRPARVRVEKPGFVSLLQPLAGHLQIAVETRKRIPALEEARMAMTVHFGR